MALDNRCFTFAPLDWSLFWRESTLVPCSLAEGLIAARKWRGRSWKLDYVLVSCLYPTVALCVELVAGVKVNN